MAFLGIGERRGWKKDDKSGQVSLISRDDALEFYQRGRPIPQQLANDSEVRRWERQGDGWTNFLAGIGYRGDKRERTYYRDWRLIMDPELQMMYLGDGLITRIVDMLPDDMTREWITLVDPDGEEPKDSSPDAGALAQIGKDLTALDSEMAYNLQLKWARLYGGALMVVGALDGNPPDQPLNYARIKAVTALRIVDRVDVHIWNSIFDTDIMSPTFGQPVVFDCIFHIGTTRVEQYVHASRCIPIYGHRVPQNVAYLMNMEHRYWGLGEIQFMYDYLRDFGGLTASVSAALYEFAIGKYKLKDLASMIATGHEQDVIRRVETINYAKSVINGVLLDANGDEDYTRDNISFAGVPDIMDRGMMLVAAVANIPVSRLFGRSAAGMNATGEGDRDSYYDSVRSKQKTQLKPAIMELMRKICAWRKIDPEIVDARFNKLEQMSESEEATIEKTKADAELARAQAYNLYVQMGALEGADVTALVHQEIIEQRMGELGEDYGAPNPDRGVESSLENESVAAIAPPVVQKVPPQQEEQKQPQPPTMVPLEQKETVMMTQEEGGGPT